MKLRKKRILVTGGAGLIGSHLVDALIEQENDVVILDALEGQTHPFGKPAWINPKAEFVHGDTRAYKDWVNALRNVEYVFHQAAFGGFTAELSHYMDVNASGTALMFEAITKENFPIKKIVTASSQAVYGEGSYLTKNGAITYPKYLRPIEQLADGVWDVLSPDDHTPLIPLLTNEERPLNTETIYGISKLAQEKLTMSLGRKLGIPVVSLRYAVTYGPRQSIYNPYTGVVSIFSTQILNGKNPVVYEDGNQTRDYLYVSDNVAANILVMEDSRADNQVFNVGRGVPVSVNEFVFMLGNVYKKKASPKYLGEFRPWDVRHFVHDSSKLSKLGWRPEISLEDGLKLYGEWIKTQGDVTDVFSEKREKMRSSGVVFQARSKYSGGESSN